MLTARGISLLIGGALAWVAGRVLGIAELYGLAVGAVALVGLGAAYVRMTTSVVSVRRILSAERVVAGAPVDVTLQLRNDGRVVTPSIRAEEQLADALAARADAHGRRARFVVEGLAPGRVVSVPYRVVATTRGRHVVGPLELITADPFGVASRTRRTTETAEVLVYPYIQSLPTAPIPGSHMGAGDATNRRISVSGDEFHTMREYVRGDDMRRVHWASTAHRQKLMVRQMEESWQAAATVYLDSRSHVHTPGQHGSLERAVSAAASLVYRLAESGYSIRLVTDQITGRAAPSTWEAALDHLADLTPSASRSLGPSLQRLRGSDGLLVAVVGVPRIGRRARAGGTGRHPDLSALGGVKGIPDRRALLVTDTADEDTVLMQRALQGSGWRAAPLTAETSLTATWADVGRARSRASGVAR